MTVFEAIILGLVQGLGEFLPISSSGHLVLAPWFLDFSDPGLSFSVALHFGTLLAVIGYFWKDWVDLFRNSFSYVFLKEKNPDNSSSLKILLLLAVASVPGAFFGYFLRDLAENELRNPLLVAFFLFSGGLLLYFADKKSREKKDFFQIKFFDAFVIGLAQALALFPGVSRSGITITAALFLGLSRTDSARFSFLLSTPIIFGAAFFEAGNLFSSPFGLIEIIGIATASLSGFLAIFFLMTFIKKIGYEIFFWYRTFLAILILALFFWG